MRVIFKNIFKKENIIGLVAIILLLGSGFLFLFKEKYHYFLTDWHFSQSAEKIMGDWELIGVVDEESFTVQNTQNQVTEAHGIHFKTEKETSLKKTLAEKYPGKVKDDISGTMGNLADDKRVPVIFLSPTASKKLVKTPDENKFLVDLSLSEKKIENLLRVLDEDYQPNFSYGLYLFTENSGSFLCLSRDFKNLFWYNGEKLSIYER